MRRIWVGFVCAMVLSLAGCDDEKKTTDDEDVVACTPGSLDCACTSSGTCDAGLTCNASQICESETGTPSGLVINTAEARACELLFEQQGATLLSASYGADTHGALRRRDPNVAIAVSRGSDTPFESDSITLVVEGDVSDLNLRTTRCFDASGAELANADVTFQ